MLLDHVSLTPFFECIIVFNMAQNPKPAKLPEDPVQPDLDAGEENLTQMACRKIKALMLNYEIVPGQRLLSFDLAKRLGVSRTPVTNALNSLATEGFLDFKSNQGYTVHQMTRAEATDLYDLREIIELGALKRALENGTSQQFENFRKRKFACEEAVVENIPRGRFELDQEFHAAYIEMAANQYLTEYFREIYQRIFLRHLIEGLPAGRAREVVVEHNKIYKAIVDRDLARARRYITNHIQTNKEAVFATLPA
jgi:DNA-binding GntR family transcriptional regulator